MIGSLYSWIIIIKSLESSFSLRLLWDFARALLTTFGRNASKNERKSKKTKKDFQPNMQSIYLCRLLPHCLYVSCAIHFCIISICKRVQAIQFFFSADAEKTFKTTIKLWRSFVGAHNANAICSHFRQRSGGRFNWGNDVCAPTHTTKYDLLRFVDVDL